MDLLAEPESTAISFSQSSQCCSFLNQAAADCDVQFPSMRLAWKREAKPSPDEDKSRDLQC